MNRPAWRDEDLAEGILREPSPDANRIILWLPGPFDGQARRWERVGNAPGAEIRVEEGICTTPATSIQASQKVRGLLGRVFGLFQKAPEGPVWVLPNGKSAEQVGARRTDLLLVWPEDENAPLTEERLRQRWPEATRLEQVGRSLFLVAGVELPPQRSQPAPAPVQVSLTPPQPNPPPAPPPVMKLAPAPANPPPPQGNPGERAQQMLAAARQAGDRGREVTALTDLALAWRRIGEAGRAVTILEEALSMTRQLGDRRVESDVLGNLGATILHIGQPAQALELLKRQLASAREANASFEEKFALENLGSVYAQMRDHARAAAAYQQALALAREVGDRQHEAELLWLLAVQSAERGHRDPAIASAERAVELFEELGSPQVPLLRDHLQQYRASDSAETSGSAEARPGPQGRPSPGRGGPGQPSSDPGLLRAAFSLIRTMANALTVGSGVETVPPPVQQSRLEVCATCEHHTGLRCRLCNSFTSVKAALPHERCPIDKWPAPGEAEGRAR
jgi:tetratricopeptide (TPR) repeat protein